MNDSTQKDTYSILSYPFSGILDSQPKKRGKVSRKKSIICRL
jgi:hypothetical protein